MDPDERQPKISVFQARPPLACGVGWLGYQQVSILAEEPSSTFGGQRRRSESPGHHHVERTLGRRITGMVLGPAADHGNRRLEPEPYDCVGEELSSTFHAVEQRPLRTREIDGKHQAREPATAAQIEPARW